MRSLIVQTNKDGEQFHMWYRGSRTIKLWHECDSFRMTSLLLRSTWHVTNTLTKKRINNYKIERKFGQIFGIDHGIIIFFFFIKVNFELNLLVKL